MSHLIIKYKKIRRRWRAPSSGARSVDATATLPHPIPYIQYILYYNTQVCLVLCVSLQPYNLSTHVYRETERDTFMTPTNVP